MPSEKSYKENAPHRSLSHSSRSASNVVNAMAYGKISGTGPDHIQNNGYDNAVSTGELYFFIESINNFYRPTHLGLFLTSRIIRSYSLGGVFKVKVQLSWCLQMIDDYENRD